MSVQENWLANLRATVDAEASGPLPRDKRRGYRAVADLTGFNEEFIYQLYSGKPKANGQPRVVSPELAAAIGRAFANGRQLDWIDQPPAGDPSTLQEDMRPAVAWPFKSDFSRFCKLSKAKQAIADEFIDFLIAKAEGRVLDAPADPEPATMAPDALSIARRFDQLSGATRDRVFAVLQNAIQLELTADELQQQAAALPSLPPTPAPAKAPADR